MQPNQNNITVKFTLPCSIETYIPKYLENFAFPFFGCLNLCPKRKNLYFGDCEIFKTANTDFEKYVVAYEKKYQNNIPDYLVAKYQKNHFQKVNKT